MRRALVIALAAVISLAAAFVIGRECGKRGAQAGVTTQIDTLFIRDTTLVICPKIVQRTRIDTLLVTGDTLRVHDTLFVAVERERIVADSVGLYHVVASGCRPSIDTIVVFPTTQVITQTITRDPSRWAVSLQAGVGIGRDFKPSPYVGVGLSYDLWRIK